MKDKQLYERIFAFDIDGGPAELTFEMRLARENGWTEGFARRVIVEYKRFVYLSMVSGHACSPSDAVDEAWHLHLTYTESYWTRFVGGILPTPLHHNPTKGGSIENAKHEDLFKRTLDSYRSEFESNAPVDIWLAKNQPKPTAIDLKEHFLISRSKLRLGLVVAAGAVGAALIFVGCMPVLAQTSNRPGDEVSTGAITGALGFVLCGLGAVAVVGTALFIILMSRARQGSASTVIVDGGADCSGGVDVGCSGGANCSGDSGQAAAPIDSGGGGSDSGSASSSSCSSSSCSSSSCSSG